jgi:hypothetical protein
MVLRDKNHSLLIPTGCYGNAAMKALNEFEHFLERCRIDGEVIRSTAGEWFIAFTDRVKQFLDLYPMNFWNDLGREMQKSSHGFDTTYADMSFILQKLMGADERTLKMNFGSSKYEEYVGRPFDPFVIAQLETIEKTLEDQSLDAAERRAWKKTYNNLMAENSK